jgi:hypothetical protein
MTAQTVLAVVGEVIVIVVGVLLALAVERWKESRAERRLETGYLRGLERDLAQDSEGLAAFCREVTEAREAAERVLAVIRGELEPDPKGFGGELMRAANGNEPVYSVAAYTEIASGNLHLIENAELKNRLVEYYSVILTGERVRSRVTPQLWYDAGVEPYLLELWRILPVGDWLGWFAGAPADIAVGEVVSALQAVPEIPQYLEGCRRCRRLQLAKFSFHQQQADALLKAVRLELEGRSS